MAHAEQLVPLLSGEIQFWRMAPEEWRPTIRAARDEGLSIVNSYLSWRRHEPEPGVFDFEGSRDPRLDVRSFLELCASESMQVHLKPGPWICAEEPGGGYPEWLLERDEILALDDHDVPIVGYNPPFQHVVPSYSSPEYRAAAARWFTAVWRAVGDFLTPNGPIALVQLDNEPSLCFQDSVFGGDYHPSALARFRDWLVERYGSADATTRAWGASPGAGARLDPPRGPSRGEPLLIDRRLEDWILFKGVFVAEHLEFLRHAHQTAGATGVEFTVNLVTHPVHDVPVSHALLRKTVDARIGEDQYYIPRPTIEDVHRLTRSAATARAADEPLPWIPELQAGIWRSPGEQVDYPDPTPAEQSAWWGAAVAAGFGGANFYMLADRENWQYAPITTDGDRSAFAAPLTELLSLAADEPTAFTGPVVPDVVVAWHKADARHAYAVTGTSRLPDVPWADETIAAAYQQWDRTLARLTAAGLSYELWPTENALPPLDVPVLVTPGSGVERQLLEAARSSGRLVLQPQNHAEVDDLIGGGALVPAIAVVDDGRVARGVFASLRRGTDDYIHVASFRETPFDATLRFSDSRAGAIVLCPHGAALSCEGGTVRLTIKPGHTLFRWRQR